MSLCKSMIKMELIIIFSMVGNLYRANRKKLRLKMYGLE